MKAKYKIKQLMEVDPEICINQLRLVQKEKDPLHLHRRQQQRAISEEMIQICLTHGIRRWIHGALTFTLNDRALEQTCYGRVSNELRGLRIVCLENGTNLRVLTAYWCDEVTKRSRTRRKQFNDYDDRLAA